jgi:hypothetical protein
VGKKIIPVETYEGTSAKDRSPEVVERKGKGYWGTGKDREHCFSNHPLLGCYRVCNILLPFDFAQGREPVERPFRDLRTYGGGFKRDPHTTLSMLNSGA